MTAAAARGAGLAAALALALTSAGCGGVVGGTPRVPPAPAAPALTVPLEDTFTAGGSSYAVVATGDLDQTPNTFWQVVTRRGDSGWKLVTPPGVADNGGLVVSAAGSHLSAAFLPSGDLTFSPLAASADGGAAWGAAGLVPGAVLAVPDALAGGAGLALVSTPEGGSLVAARAGGSWKTVVTAKALEATAAGRTCDVGGLTAVALGPGGARLVGASCGQPVAGIFDGTGGTGRWSLVPLELPPALRSAPVNVLRLVAPVGPAGRGDSARSTAPVPALAGLLSGGGTAPWIAACWAPGAGGPWRLSQALQVGKGASLVSTGFGPAGEAVVVWRDAAGRLSGATDTGPGETWSMLPPLPDGTLAVVTDAGGTEALSVATSVVTDWRLDASRHAWTKEQQLDVPISFGSSG